MERLKDEKIERWKDRKMERWKDRKMRQKDGKIARWKDRKTDRQMFIYHHNFHCTILDILYIKSTH